jgi:hypothetical protein
MTSSTSNSEVEPDAPSRARWRRWLVVFLATLAASFAGVLAAVVVLDPYSTGRLTPIRRVDIAIPTRPFNVAGLARDQRFNAAVLGNSHGLSIEPEILNEATGARFVQLWVYGQLAPDTMFLLDVFDRLHRPQKPTLVVVLDFVWCDAERGRSVNTELPRWLYEGSDLDYLRQLPSPLAVMGALRRLLILAGLAAPAGRADGFVPDQWNPGNRAVFRREMEGMKRPTDIPDMGKPYPYLDDLAEHLAKLDVDSPVVLIFPPVYIDALPVPNSAAEAKIDECKDRARRIAQLRPRTGFVDLQIDGPLARDISNFVDARHVDGRAVGELNSAVLEALRDLTGGTESGTSTR